ncbi:MAG: hypothetical protein WKF35_11185 [Ferruginibacter sp.]
MILYYLYIKIRTKTFFLLLIFFSLLFQAVGQNEHGNNKNTKPEVFSSGFIDVMNNGQVNASARMIKLYIGDTTNFSIPISFYGGVSNNMLQTSGTSKSNDILVNQFINPLSGLVNISTENYIYFKKSEKISKLSFLYQIGVRILNGSRVGLVSDPLTGKPVNFLNTFTANGLMLETGAWEKGNTSNVGIFRMALRYHLCHSSSKQIREFLPNIKTNGIYSGYSLGFGIDINNVVNIKTIYYKYFKAPEIDYGFPIYQFSFNYHLQK